MAGDTCPLNTRRIPFFPLYLRRPFILAFLVSRSSRSPLTRAGAINSPLIVIKSVQTITPLLLLLLFLLPHFPFPAKAFRPSRAPTSITRHICAIQRNAITFTFCTNCSTNPGGSGRGMIDARRGVSRC